MRLLISAHLFWLAIVCVLGAWWSRLVLKQASRIAELETAAGMAAQAVEHEMRTQRMVYWESLSYFGLLIGSTAVVFWLYWRDLKRSRGVRAFFAAMTHELRTPLTSIRLQAESLADGAAPSPLIDRLLEDTQRLESQVERTLELARVEGGGPVYPEPIDLRAWLDRITTQWKDNYPKLQIQLDVPAECSVQADPTALGVIFRNLLENSLRHAKREPLEILIRAAGPVITFSDNGPGYNADPRKLGLIFEKGPGSSGTGVGLYLIRVLCEQMGGRADFANGPGFAVSIHLKEGGHG